MAVATSGLSEPKSKENLELHDVTNSLKESSKDLKKLWYQCNNLCHKEFAAEKSEAAGITKYVMIGKKKYYLSQLSL